MHEGEDRLQTRAKRPIKTYRVFCLPIAYASSIWPVPEKRSRIKTAIRSRGPMKASRP
jgi:hypothetical protein